MYDRANPSLLEILGADDTLPLDPHVQTLWIANLRSPLRRGILSLTRIVRTLTLYVFYFSRRITPGFLQFSFPNLLQRIICFFMKWFVTPEANHLILRHFWAESNVINFIIKNSRNRGTAELLQLYPRTIDDLLVHTFVKHDIALFNAFHDLGSIEQERWPVPREAVDFSALRPIEVALDPTKRRFTQIVDFETAHELFKATFCLLLTWEEYERSVVSLQFDQLLAIRLSRIVGDPMIAALATNRFPMLLMGPTGVGYRFILHGLFTEYVHEHLVRLPRETPERRAAS